MNDSEKGVFFIDYDGSIIEHWTVDEAIHKEKMPEIPDHPEFHVYGWNWTLDEIQDCLNADSDSSIYVSPFYMFTDGITFTA